MPFMLEGSSRGANATSYRRLFAAMAIAIVFGTIAASGRSFTHTTGSAGLPRRRGCPRCTAWSRASTSRLAEKHGRADEVHSSRGKLGFASRCS